MNPSSANPVQTLQLFQPDPQAFYSIETVAHLTHLPRHLILVCYKHGLISMEVDPDYGGFYFDEEAIHTLQRVEYLWATCGVNIPGIVKILELSGEIERLRAELEHCTG